MKPPRTGCGGGGSSNYTSPQPPPPPPPIVADVHIATASLPDGIRGRSYSAWMTATGGSGIYQWSVSSGVPPGTTISRDGAISGTPTQPGNFSFTVSVSDTSSPAKSDSRIFSIAVADALTITTAALAGAPKVDPTRRRSAPLPEWERSPGE